MKMVIVKNGSDIITQFWLLQCEKDMFYISGTYEPSYTRDIILSFTGYYNSYEVRIPYGKLDIKNLRTIDIIRHLPKELKATEITERVDVLYA